MYWDALSALRDSIKECVDLSCEYRFIVSLGQVPEECNLIAFYLKDSRRAKESSECDTIFDTSFVVSITRCCYGIDGQLTWNIDQEEQEAQCFLNDLNVLRECLACTSAEVLAPYTMACSPIIEDITTEAMREGGCYTAYIEMSFAEQQCCG